MFIMEKYAKQETDFEKKIQDAIDTYDCDKIGMYGKIFFLLFLNR